MKIALVHDQLSEFGGAERVLLVLSEMWPEAPIYTAFYQKGSPAWERFKDRDIRPSWAHYIPGFASKLHSPLRFLAPAIWNSFDFSDYDVIIGSSSWYITKGFTKKGPLTGSGRARRLEICYCHTPPRWLYGYTTSRQGALAKAYGTMIGFFMRQYDFCAAQRVDYFIANSKETAGRIRKFYRREAQVIYPPVEENFISQSLNLKQMSKIKQKADKGYYLVISRLAQSKNIDLAIRAATKLKRPLKIGGTGPDEARLRSLAGPRVEFMGHVPERELPHLYAGARAFLALSKDEDFGMTPVEAMAAGTPVIAYRGGGYLETVVEGKTGVFFDSLDADTLRSAIVHFEDAYRPSWREQCILQSKQFDRSVFEEKMRSALARAVSRGNK